MIRFQYDHNIGQWRWNISKNAVKLDEKIFDAMRNALSGNEFTYAAVGNGEFVCMSTIPGDGASISEGTVVGVKGAFSELPNKPSCYVSKWSKYDVLPTDDIPEGELPSPDTLVEYDFFPEFLPELLDAILYSNKKLVVLVPDNGVAIDCIKAINYMLPPAFAKKIGFSVGAEKIPDTTISVMTESGKSLPANVRVFFTSSTKIDINSQSYFVFDADPDEPTHNYKAELSAFGSVVRDYCLETQNYMDAMTKHIAPAFDEAGNLDMDMLKRLSLLFRFTLNPDDKTADGLVGEGMGNGADKVQKNAFLGACRYVWRHINPSLVNAEKRAKMVEAYNSSLGGFNESDSVDYLKYILSQGGGITEGERAILEDIAVTRGCLGDSAEVLFKNRDFAVRKDVFELVAKILAKEPNVYSNEELITEAIKYFDIAECFGVLNQNGQSESGEELFSIAGKVQNAEVRTILCSILMTSCFTVTTAEYSPHTPIRVKGLRRMIKELNLSAMEQIACVVKIHRTMGDISGIGSLEINDFAYFLCDRGRGELIPEWTKWIRATVDSLSISQLIDMEKVLLNSDYIGLKEIVEAKLLNLDYIAPHLRRDVNLRLEYKRVFAMLNNDNQYRAIDFYLIKLENEGQVEERFLQQRWSFVKGAYDTLSESDKKKVGAMAEKPDGIKPDKRNETVSRVQELFLGNTVKKTGVLDVILPYVNVVVWGAIAFFLMMVLSNILSGMLMAGHSSIISDFMLLPIVSAASSVLLYCFNTGRNLITRNIITAIETAVFVAAMLIAFYGSFAILGFII